MQLSQIEFLNHILSECNYLIKESASNSFDDLASDERLIRAVCRSLEIIGEAGSKVHPDIKAKYPIVPWREMTDIRNRIIHHYFGVDHDIIWDTIQNNIPQLKEWIEVVIDKETNQ